jgi:hypothetical protein
MARRTNQLNNVEGLETRDVMSGNVAAYVSSNTLYLNEAYGQYGQHNNVKVSQLASGAVRVTGLVNASGTQTLINGAYYRDFYIPGGSLVANFGAGIDRLTVGAVNLNNVYADLGLTGVNDVDVIDVNGARLAGAMDLRTGGGADNIYVRSTRVGDGSGYEDLKINSGAGADYVQVGVIGGNFVEIRGNLLLNTAAGAEIENDIVKVNQALVYHSIYLDTGSGNDTIQMGYTTAGEDIVITAGDGADTGNLTEVWAYDQFYVAMGVGNDTLTTTYLRANYLSLDGGYLGFDKLYHYQDGPTGQTWYSGWEVIN